MPDQLFAFTEGRTMLRKYRERKATDGWSVYNHVQKKVRKKKKCVQARIGKRTKLGVGRAMNDVG